MITVLPVRHRPHPDQSLPCWLEHLADANGLSAAGLTGVLGHMVPAPGLRFLSLRPSPAALNALATLTGAHPTEIARATLARYDRLAVDLSGLDHAERHSYRQVAARGWTPARGSQLCPACLTEHSQWHTAWRLPISTICTRHRTYLTHTCPTCRRVFRDHTHTPIRPTGTSGICGNPHGPGPAEHCPQPLTDLPTSTPSQDQLATAARIDTALAGHPVTMLGRGVPAAVYLHTLRHLSVLLMHLAGHPAAAAPWAAGLTEHAHTRHTDRPRWAIRPPDEPSLRAAALASADAILTHPDPPDPMRQWLRLIPPGTARGTWIRDHTTVTDELAALLSAAEHPTRRLSGRLPHLEQTPDLRRIPHLIPTDTYTTHLGAVLPASDTTRLFAALCLARRHRHITTWAHAAAALGLPAHVGPATARLCSTPLAGRNDTWLAGLHTLAAALHDTGVDYRATETAITARARTHRWFIRWARSHRPGTHPTSHTYAVAWLWVHIGSARLEQAPSFTPGPATPAQRRAYRAFAHTLSDDQAQHLAATLTT